MAEQAQQAEEIASGFGGRGFRWATDAAERNKLWQARHDALWAALALKPGHKGIATDAIVPISRLDEAILGAKEDIAASGLTAPIVGHVGDGNFHTVILVPPEPDGLARAWELDKKIVARALSLGGSCSGEHGVGIGKREFLEQEHGAGSAGGDALGEAGAGPARDPQSGQDLPELRGAGRESRGKEKSPATPVMAGPDPAIYPRQGVCRCTPTRSLRGRWPGRGPAMTWRTGVGVPDLTRMGLRPSPRGMIGVRPVRHACSHHDATTGTHAHITTPPPAHMLTSRRHRRHAC